MNYQQYLDSSWWKLRKRIFLNEQGKKCSFCSSKNELDVHHLNYQNLGDERDSDLLVLCRRCHKDIHYFADCSEPTECEIKQSQVVTEDIYQAKIKELITHGGK